jgi:hypothetical protein
MKDCAGLKQEIVVKRDQVIAQKSRVVNAASAPGGSNQDWEP